MVQGIPNVIIDDSDVQTEVSLKQIISSRQSFCHKANLVEECFAKMFVRNCFRTTSLSNNAISFLPFPNATTQKMKPT